MLSLDTAALQTAALLDVELPARSRKGRPRLKRSWDGAPKFDGSAGVSLAYARAFVPARGRIPSQLRTVLAAGVGLALCRRRCRNSSRQRGCVQSYWLIARATSRAVSCVAVHAVGEEDLDDGWTVLHGEEDQAGIAVSFDENDEDEEQQELVVVEDEEQYEAVMDEVSRKPYMQTVMDEAYEEPYMPEEQLVQKGGTCDAVMVRLQSSKDMRRAATWTDQYGNQHFAELVNAKLFDRTSGKPTVGGLFCTQSFGAAQKVQRRFQMGILELAWPTPHAWFTSRRNIATMVHLMGKTPSSWEKVRKFGLDVYLGDWTATTGAYLRNNPLSDGITWNPFVGSPVAAETLPRIHSVKQEACLLPLIMNAPLESKRTLHALASMASTAWSRQLCSEVSQLSASIRSASQVTSSMAAPSSAMAEAVGAVAKLDAELPVHAIELLAFQKQTQPQDATEELAVQLHERLPQIVKQTLCEQLQLSPTDAEGLLWQFYAQPQRNGDIAPQLREAAQRDPLGLWEALTAPGLASFGDRSLEEKLDEVERAILGYLQRSDGLRALAATKRLLTQGQAALDIILNACCNTSNNDQAAGTVATKRPQRSRFNRSSGNDIYWYETAMPVAAFHIEDVNRVSHALNVKYDRQPVKSDNSVLPPITVSTKQLSNTAGSGIRVPQQKKDWEFRSVASFYRRGERSDIRWHLPLHDCERPGKGGGFIPLETGELLECGFDQELLRYAAARPRPAASPPSLPRSIESDCASFVSSGGAGMRSCLGRTDLFGRIRDLHRQRGWMDGVQEIADYLESMPDDVISEHVSYIRSFRASTEFTEARARIGASLEKLEYMASKQQLPESMVLSALPVLPPDLRSIDDIESSGQGRSSDINATYVAIVKQGETLRKALRERVPDKLLRYYKLLVQNTVDNVIDPGIVDEQRPGTSLVARIQGKAGRMRGNMLGKRVDYSARTVIVVEPKLQMDECGLPYRIARVLFEPFLVHELMSIQNVSELFGQDWAEKIEKETEETMPRRRHDTRLRAFDEMEDVNQQWRILQNAIGHKKVLLNRAPTLHRLSVQAFHPKLVDGQALRIHPLICSPFNADFDGDTMTVHLALSEEAQDELEKRMLTSQNLHSPASGEPVVGPTQDMVLGMYYLTAHPLASSDGRVDGMKLERECTSLEDLQKVATDCEAGELPCAAVVSVPRDVLLDIAPDACEDDELLAVEAVAAGKDDEVSVGETANLIKTTAGRMLFFLLVHHQWTPPSTTEEQLAEKVDKVLGTDAVASHAQQIV